MNIKMAINSQLSRIESKKQTKQINRTETESQVWTSLRGLSVGRKGTGIKQYELAIDKGVLRTVEEMEQPKNLYA